jgi:hypothetical protein
MRLTPVDLPLREAKTDPCLAMLGKLGRVGLAESATALLSACTKTIDRTRAVCRLGLARRYCVEAKKARIALSFTGRLLFK